MDKKRRIGLHLEARAKLTISVVLSAMMGIHLTYGYVRDSGRTDFTSSFPSPPSVS